MTKETFVEIINKIQEFDKFLDKLSDLHIDILNVNELWIPGYLWDKLLKELFGEKGIDAINRWLLEEHFVETPEELYNYIVELLDDKTEW